MQQNGCRLQAQPDGFRKNAGKRKYDPNSLLVNLRGSERHSRGGAEIHVELSLIVETKSARAN
jgi:hypothetical protein